MGLWSAALVNANVNASWDTHTRRGISVTLQRPVDLPIRPVHRCLVYLSSSRIGPVLVRIPAVETCNLSARVF